MKCLDTYALIAIAHGDPAFARYIAEDFAIPDTTLAEFYGVLLRDFPAQTAEDWLERLAPYSRPVGRGLLLEAIRFRLAHRKQNLSFFDAVGYAFAQSQKIPFVTGDKEFEGMTGVEFMKEGTPRRPKPAGR
jgi:predicted nucleic acid-binding protein